MVTIVFDERIWRDTCSRLKLVT